MITAGVIFDIYDDPQFTVIQSGDGEKIASCEVASPSVLNILPDSSFAMLIKTASGHKLRKYPRHSDDSRNISKFYLEKQASAIPDDIREKVAAALDDALLNPVEVNLGRKDQAKTAHYGLEVDGNHYFPIDTTDQIKEAAASFHMSADDLLPHERYIYAQNIIKQASANGLNWEELDGSDAMRSYASSKLEKVAWNQGVRSRMRECLDREKVAALKSYNPSSASSAVRYLEEWDKIANVNGKVPDAYASVFYKMEKRASKNDKIASITEDQLKTAFDESFIDQWKEDPVSVYESLPNPVKAMIDENFL